MIATLLQHDYNIIINLFGNVVVLQLFRIDVMIWNLSHHYYAIIWCFGKYCILIWPLLCDDMVLLSNFQTFKLS